MIQRRKRRQIVTRSAALERTREFEPATLAPKVCWQDVGRGRLDPILYPLADLVKDMGSSFTTIPDRRKDLMRGRMLRRTWSHNPNVYAPPRYRRACSYEAFMPDPIRELRIDVEGGLAGVISEAEGAIRALNALARPALAPLARLLLRTESIASSKVEGMQVDIRDLARAEVRLDVGGKAGPTAIEVLANIDAMQLAIEEAAGARRLDVELLVEIHAQLMAGAPNSGIAGRIRDSQNWIGGNDYNPCGADFVPPPPERVDELLTDLCEAAEEETLPPLVQAAIAHAQFETIHPFLDGNGRTGRALLHVILRRRELAPEYVPPISVIFAADKKRYIEGLTWYRDDQLAGWIERFAVAAARAAGLAAAYLEAVEALQEGWRRRLRESVNPRADAAAWILLDVLPAHPVLTLPVGVAATGRTKPAVNQAIDQLVTAGVLRTLSTARRTRSWEADGLLDLLGNLEAGRAPS
jgi:Fic family protein